MRSETTTLPCGEGMLSLHDLFKVCQRLGVFRLVKPDDDEKYFSVIICGVFKIRKNKKSGRVTQWVLFDDWKRRKSLPVSISLFWRDSDSYRINEWLAAAIKHVLNTQIDNGVKIKGDISLFRIKNRQEGRSRLQASLFPDEVMRDELHDCEDGYYGNPLGERPFVYPGFNQCRYGVRLEEEIIKKICVRIDRFISIGTKTAASKLLSKHIWSFIERPVFSHFARANYCSLIRQSVIHANFDAYLSFARRIKVDGDVDFQGLWPMIGKLKNDERGNKYCLTGKTKELYSLLKLPRTVTYGDFKALRHCRVSLVAALKAHFLKRNVHRAFPIAIRLLRNPLIKRYPVQVICNLFEWLELHFPRQPIPGIGRICEKWLEYHQTLRKNIGVRQQERRWQTEINQLTHALDWCVHNRPTINKNQNWPSFWRQSEDWTRRLRENDYHGYSPKPIPDCWTGTGIIWNERQPEVKELMERESLRVEGVEMEHCIYSYASQCASGNYLAFSIRCGKERATLGLSRCEHHKIYRLDQMRGCGNEAVSREMMRKGRNILKTVNAQLNPEGNHA